MAASVSKILNYLGLVDPPEGDDQYHAAPFGSSHLTGAMPVHEDIRNSEPVRLPAAAAPLHAPSVAATVASFAASSTAKVDAPRIAMVHPQTYNDARGIGDDFRAGVPVIMNVGDMDFDSAKRLVDFAAGLAYGLGGSCEKVAPGVFLLSPANYDLTAAARAQFQGSFFNQS